MFRVNEQIIARSMTDFSVSGLELLSPTENYLYVSNHRDIMLDASLLQYYLVLKGFETTEITFGANLMMNPVVIDVGVNRIPDSTKKSGFRLVGDVDFENVKEVASYITPVPKGVGPMTIAMLIYNTLEAAERQNGLSV